MYAKYGSEIAREYNNGAYIKELAEKHGCCTRTMRKFLVNNGCDIVHKWRKNRRDNSSYPLNQYFFSEITSEQPSTKVAKIFGILLYVA
jgi:hypothetical protein